MIDDLSHQLDSLAGTIDHSVDLSALHRRISRQSGRRTAMRVGVAAGGLAAIVGGLVVVRAAGPSPAPAAESPAADNTSTSTSASPVAPLLPDCTTLLASAPASVNAANKAAGAEQPTFKGVVSIVAVDREAITVVGDERNSNPPGTHTIILDSATRWENDATVLGAPATLHVGDTVGIVAVAASDGVEHAIVVDVGARTSTPDRGVDFKGLVSIVAIDGSTIRVSGGEPMASSSTTRALIVDGDTQWRNGSTVLDAPATLHVGDTVAIAALTANDGIERAVVVDVDAKASSHVDPIGVGTKARSPIVLPASPLAPGPTSKSRATITAVTDAAITVTLHGDDEGKTSTADIASTTFYVDDAVCRPTDLTVGRQVAVAFHLDATSAVVADAILLTP
jgi:hypothetical protein